MMHLGEYDERDPAGSGYRVMTRKGLLVFDITEKAEYLAEREKARKRPYNPARQCKKCISYRSPSCIPPASGPCLERNIKKSV